jgi:WD40 repeat protein
MLCGIFACDGKVLVVGGKDKVLRAYEVATGKLLYVLSGHQASICSMANHGQLISSGGDHGCSSLIVWDVKTWNIRSKVQLHSAAVTCIVDLQDSSNLVTGSFDRKINIFSYRRGVVIFTVNSCKAGITCMGLTSDKHRLISSLLDNSIAIWKITRDVLVFNYIGNQHHQPGAGEAVHE